jgi:hypothetical protein
VRRIDYYREHEEPDRGHFEPIRLSADDRD